MKLTPKKYKALLIYDVSLNSIKANGRSQIICGIKTLQLDLNDLKLMRSKIMNFDVLDIWNKTGKVFSIHSNENEFHIVNFKRGDWENIILSGGKNE